jgi:hypothetical protein
MRQANQANICARETQLDDIFGNNCGRLRQTTVEQDQAITGVDQN